MIQFNDKLRNFLLESLKLGKQVVHRLYKYNYQSYYLLSQRQQITSRGDFISTVKSVKYLQFWMNNHPIGQQNILKIVIIEQHDFQMILRQNKMIQTSRFRANGGRNQFDYIRESAKVYHRFKTEESDSTKFQDQSFKTMSNKKSVTSRKPMELNLQNLIRSGSKQRKLYLESITPQYKPIVKPIIKESKPSLSRKQKQNVKKSILEAINETPRRNHKFTEHHENLIRSSFNKLVKELKQKNYIRREDETEVVRDKIEGHGASIKGEKHSVNQDSLAFSEKVFIVCDGHGTNGKQISEFVCNLTHKMFQQSLKENKMDPIVIKQVLRKVQIELDMFGIDIAFSGCTFIGIVIHENTIYSINIGDSKAILCQGLGITEISTMHKPDNLIQRQRIEQCGGVIHPLEIGKDKYSGPNRIWAPGKASWGPGLALSRAFGDKAARKFGVISQPQIRTFSLNYEDDFITLGSDGLFDFMKDSDISFFIRKNLKDDANKEQIPLLLVEEAKRVSGSDSDDISCIIIFL